MTAYKQTDPLNQQVSFIQHFLTGMDAGGYQLTLQQRIASNPTTPYQSSYTFGVTADRYALANPAAAINSVFPADNASGEFSNVLPHVVFTQKTMPWVRRPTTALPYKPPAPGADTEADVPTWLWVMLLDQDDVEACAQLGLSLKLTPATHKVADLFPQAALPTGITSSLGENYSYFLEAKNVLGLEVGQTLDDVIQTIDVPLGLFWKIAPTVDDLRQMAHGRAVSLIHKNTTVSVADPGTPNGEFAIVFGNRLPADQKRTSAFLVSLEQLEEFLPAEGGEAPAGSHFNGELSLRLAVLRSWTFFSTGQPAMFVHQLESLNGRTPDGGPALNTNLRVPYQGSSPAAQGAFKMGYLPLNETLRTGGKTVSWYRGPLAPYHVAKQWLQLPIPSPDAALVFDPTTGMLDASYASAWSIGRMLALQDTDFSSAYYNWKRGLEHQIFHALEDRLLEASLGQSLARGGPSRQLQAVTGSAAPQGSRSLLKRTILSLNPE